MLLRTKAANWEEFARDLGIGDNYRSQLKEESRTSSAEKILDKILTKWIDSETSEVTWKKIIDVLTGLEYIALVRNVKTYLRKEDVIKKYCKRMDFTGE